MGLHEKAAAELRKAYQEGQVPPLREILGPNDAVGAYRVQAINTRFWQEQGRRISGRKVGLTAKTVQAQLGVNQPDYGVLFEDMAVPNGGVLDPGRTLQAKAEAEVAIVIAHPLRKPDATYRDIVEASSHAVAAIEIVDSRILDWKISFADTVADNGSSAFYVLGAGGRRLQELDLYTCGMVLEVNGAVVSLGAGAACLGHPLEAAAWLARTLAANGEGLNAGDVILTGALGPMIPLRAGDQVTARIGGLGSVSFSFGGAA